ncbi:MAG: DNA-3-methyladenine glycosylase [Ignavibacteriales bacterium]|nr:DNA-3-methyladenine glycosylase [Ignavibacteriales bacterium]
MQKLPISFYTRNVHMVAKELLGKIFVRKYSSSFLSGRIVEVEAYDGSVDESAHSFIGKTKRNEVMFNGGGLLYVYFTYGMHFCANVVTGKVNEGCAVLIRAVEPIDGIDLMSQNRFHKISLSEKEKLNLTNGPAKFCQAFAITKEQNGISLLSDEIFIVNANKINPSEIVNSKRIGIKKSVDLPWRYFIKDNPFVSKK